MSEKTNETKNIVVQLLDINGKVKQYNDVKFIKIVSKNPRAIICVVPILNFFFVMINSP